MMRQTKLSPGISGKTIYAHKATPDAHLPTIVLKTIIYIDENLTSDLSIKTLAKVFSHNGQYISHRFKESMGIPLQQYIICKRLELSKKHLAAGCSLTCACSLSGFHDYPNFSKTFSKHEGISPKIYQLEMYASALYDRQV